MFDTSMVMIVPESASGTGGKGKHTVIFLFRSGAGGSDVDIEREMRKSLSEQTGETGSKEVEDLGTEAIQVAGREVVFRKTRSVGGDSGEQVLQYIGALPVRENRATMLMFAGPEQAFDRKAMDAFLGSIQAAGK